MGISHNHAPPSEVGILFFSLQTDDSSYASSLFVNCHLKGIVHVFVLCTTL